MRFPLIAVALLMASAGFAAEPIPKSDGAPKKNGFAFPPVRPGKTDPPAPAPIPGAVPILTGDTLYVIPHDEPFLLFDSPRGLVTITREAGPLRIRGKFLDGNGKIETRNYTQKYLAIVEAVPGVSGRVELIAVPQGVVDEGGAQRQLIDANQAPQPPPVPDVIPEPKPKPPDVDPKPAPKPQPVVDGPLWLVTVSESTARTSEEAAVIEDLVFWKALEAKGHKFRHYDPDETTAKSAGYSDVYAELGACLVIVQPKPGGGKSTVLEKIKLPASTADVAALVKKLTGK